MNSLRTTKIPEETLKHKVVMWQDQNHSSFTAAALTQTTTLFGIPAKHVIVGVRALLVTSFVAFGMSSCNVTVGATSLIDPTITTTNYYLPAFSCKQIVSPTSFMYWSPFAMYTIDPQSIKAIFTAVGAQLNTITAGEIEFEIMYRPL